VEMLVIWGMMIKMYAFAYKKCKHVAVKIGPNVLHGATLYVAAICMLATSLTVGGANAQKGATTATCINPYSGVTWQISIDYDRSTVDGNPARISDSEISWRNRADGSNYTLDRKSGNLTVIIASSTGGFFLHDRCKLEN
jgi:hypothetical protein